VRAHTRVFSRVTGVYLQQVQDTAVEIVEWVIDRVVPYDGEPIESLARSS